MPFHFDDCATSPDPGLVATVTSTGDGQGKVRSVAVTTPVRNPDGTTSIGEVRWRQHVKVHGRIQTVRVAPLGDSPSLECTIVDHTGGVSALFFGRRHIDGITIGAMVTVEGMTIDHHGRLAIVNPIYELH